MHGCSPFTQLLYLVPFGFSVGYSLPHESWPARISENASKAYHYFPRGWDLPR